MTARIRRREKQLLAFPVYADATPLDPAGNGALILAAAGMLTGRRAVAPRK